MRSQAWCPGQDTVYVYKSASVCAAAGLVSEVLYRPFNNVCHTR